MKELRDDVGNVVLELVLAVSLFGGLLWPAVSAISSVAVAYRQAEDATSTVARAWTVTDAQDRPQVISTLRASLVARASRTMTLHVTCTPSCSSVDAVVRVSASVATGVFGFEYAKVSYSLDRDAYGR